MFKLSQVGFTTRLSLGLGPNTDAAARSCIPSWGLGGKREMPEETARGGQYQEEVPRPLRQVGPSLAPLPFLPTNTNCIAPR